MKQNWRNRGEDGVILVHVLGLMAFASAIVFLMLRLQDLSIDQAQRTADREQAEAIARGGEASIVTAFRRDGLEDERLDHYGEAWAQAAQQRLEIAGGSFAVTVEDAQAKFNINRLAGNRLSDVAMFQRIGLATGLSQAKVLTISEGIAAGGPLADLQDLVVFGIEVEDIETLSSMTTALPGQGAINANTASEVLLHAVFNNPGSVARLLSARERYGFLSRETVAETGVLLPTGLGLTTDHLYAHTQAMYGDARVALTSTIERRTVDTRPVVKAIARTEAF